MASPFLGQFIENVLSRENNGGGGIRSRRIRIRCQNWGGTIFGASELHFFQKI